MGGLLVYYCVMKSFYYNLEESDISEGDRKLVHWVSPHMHPVARNVKTKIEKVEEERNNVMRSTRSIKESKSIEREDYQAMTNKKTESYMQPPAK